MRNPEENPAESSAPAETSGHASSACGDTPAENADRPPLDYVERVNLAIDHVLSHLAEPLRLEDVAHAACFSPCHFHRVFKAILGETLATFVKRVRVERALTVMSRDPGRKLTDIGLSCGFASSSDFSRAFKQRYGMPPSVFDIDVWRRDRRGELDALMADADHHVERLPDGANPDGFEVTIRELPPRTVAYIRVLQPYREHAVFDATQRLLDWAEQRGVADGRWYGSMWEDPEVTALEDCRYDVSVELDDVVPEGEVGRYDFPAMRVAQVTLKGDILLEIRALQWLFSTWLPTSGWLPAELPSFEAWHGRPFAHGMEHFELDAQLPVVRA